MKYRPLLSLPLVFFYLGTCLAMAQSPSKKVLFDHDGGVDDLLSLLLLTQMEQVELMGVVVTPADCFLEDAMTSTLKILALTGHTEVQVAGSDARPVNPFPTKWRAQPMVINAFPAMLNTTENREQISNQPGAEFIAQQLRESEEPVTILITGPCTHTATALARYPELRQKVQQVIWMGGAVDVKGNVAAHKHNGTAEWNAHWDPYAASVLFELGLDVKLIALDVTNSVPVNMDFLKRLARQQEYPLSNLASQCWATTINSIPTYEYTYFMWDALATAYLGIPEAFSSEKAELAVHTNVPAAGQTYRAEGNGNWVNVVKTVDQEIFYQYILRLLSQKK